ncbi:MAG: 4-(cytidine 5'-diphospho)-2-C-methyl-D-erythritol kinase [Deltaproteobacteria bacterium]|nr:4-(cytidine 5'-diphospho)-2-C-methyl-D-erythritol kinase [Deltaproteobacteria bacterium]MBI3391266.1 4-(cytidine 5'-diphospho)-2-C-methyl-D-erythritol kinase [Deltaproteobacteria bacterium]
MSAPITQRVLAPAKVNLFLRVVGQRADGYHLLESLMLPVDLFDELRIAVDTDAAPHVTLRSDSPDVPADATNLAARAAVLFLQLTQIRAAVDIELVKRIPPGSGLGGGSSDAATTLTTLNRMLDAGRTADELAAWGARLGADVPFFVFGRPALVEGAGEVVSRLAGWDRIPLVLAFPGIGLSTAAVYQQYDARQDRPRSLTKRVSATSIADFATSGRPVRELLVNDLEAVAAELRPELLSLKSLLVQFGATGALMTGSGSAVFGIWPTRAAAEVAAEVVRGRGFWAVAVETLQVSPAAA